MAWTFLKQQGVPPLVSAVEIAGGALAKAENAAVTDVKGDAYGVSFTLQAKALPLPVHEKALQYVGEFNVEESLNREVVKVGGLAAGTYALKIDGDEVGRYTSDELASGVRLGFNAKTPQYRQAQDVARRHEELRAREAVLRGHHLVRRWLLRNKAPVDDIAAFRVWHDEKVKSGKDGPWDGVPGYLEYWPKRRQVMSDLLRDQEAVRRQARPHPHRYEIVPVG